LTMRLDGKVAVITGADGGLGAFVTNAFLDSGARVAGVSPSIQNSSFPQVGFLALPTAITSGADARAVADAVLAKWGRIDALIHLVGGFTGGKTVSDTEDAAIEKMLDLNLRAAFHILRAVLPGMRAQGAGSIAAIGSRTAVEPQPMLGAYSASKAALVSLVQTVALENKDRGITANVILPGTMDTPANRAAMPAADFSKWVKPGQIASLLVHLATEEASQISGAVIPVYGSEL
jgi:NAD(P)-dependent dehydrogenase (short-subunit alcohol dehydrogenase family)